MVTDKTFTTDLRGCTRIKNNCCGLTLMVADKKQLPRINTDGHG